MQAGLVASFGSPVCFFVLYGISTDSTCSTGVFVVLFEASFGVG